MTPEQEERQVKALEAIAAALARTPVAEAKAEAAELRAKTAESLVVVVSAERDAAMVRAGEIVKPAPEPIEETLEP